MTKVYNTMQKKKSSTKKKPKVHVKKKNPRPCTLLILLYRSISRKEFSYAEAGGGNEGGGGIKGEVG